MLVPVSTAHIYSGLLLLPTDCKGFECWNNIVWSCIGLSCMALPAVPLTGCLCYKVHHSLHATSTLFYSTLIVEFVPRDVSTLVLCSRDTMQWRCNGRVLVGALWSRDTLHATSIARCPCFSDDPGFSGLWRAVTDSSVCGQHF